MISCWPRFLLSCYLRLLTSTVAAGARQVHKKALRELQLSRGMLRGIGNRVDNRSTLGASTIARAVGIVGVVLIFYLALTSSALLYAKSGWLLMVPPLNEAKLKELGDDQKFQRLSSEAKHIVIRRLALRKDAPVLEWAQWSAHDSAADCENRKAQETGSRINILVELVIKMPEDESRGKLMREELLRTQIELGQIQAGRCLPVDVVFSPGQ